MKTCIPYGRMLKKDREGQYSLSVPSLKFTFYPLDGRLDRLLRLDNVVFTPKIGIFKIAYLVSEDITPLCSFTKLVFSNSPGVKICHCHFCHGSEP